MLTGMGYARWSGRTWHSPVFRAVWLVFLGFLPQLTAVYLPFTRDWASDELASAGLVWSQAILLLFTLINFKVPGMPVLAVGLAFNLTAILANGGFMPLPFETAQKFVDPNILSTLETGRRISNASKDILLAESNIVLPWLSDRFVSPAIIPYRFAFSLGDIFVATGAFWMCLGIQPVRAHKSGDS